MNDGIIDDVAGAPESSNLEALCREARDAMVVPPGADPARADRGYRTEPGKRLEPGGITAAAAWGTDPRADIIRYLRLVTAPGEVIELRILKAVDNPKYGAFTLSGYFDFDHLDDLADAALEWTALAEGVYVTINPVVPDLLARAANRLARRPQHSTGDKEIVRRVGLVIDFDPDRPAGISATDAEKERAWQKLEAVRLDLQERGWPTPIVADSGNGYHARFAVDLPAEDDGLIERCLKALSATHSDDAVKVDVSLFNASRIIKLYGTLSRKGDDLKNPPAGPPRPHRRAQVISAPARLEIVPRPLLEALAAECPEDRPKASKGKTSAHGQAGKAAQSVRPWGGTTAAGRPREKKPGAGVLFPETGRSPVEDFEERTDWPEILPDGWEEESVAGERTYYRRPDKESGKSASVVGNWLHVFTDAAPPFEPGQNYSKLDAYALLNHDGDTAAAVKALVAEGYGTYIDRDGSERPNPPPADWRGKKAAAGTAAAGAAATTVVAGLVEFKISPARCGKHRVSFARPGGDWMHEEELRLAEARPRAKLVAAVAGKLSDEELMAAAVGGRTFQAQLEAALVAVRAKADEEAAVAKAAKAAAPADDPRPEIRVSAEEHENANEAIAALAAAPELFQRGRMLVTIQRAEARPAARKGQPRRPAGAMVIAALPTPQIRRLMGVHARWTQAVPEPDGEFRTFQVTPPKNVVEMVATMGRWRGIRPLTGIIEAPTLRPDGSLISAPGYDEETGLFLIPAVEFPKIPDRPTRDDASAAAYRLGNLVGDFPFAGPPHEAAWLAAALTVLGRAAIDGPCPLFMLDANTAGSGKSKLCDLIAILATGRPAPRQSYTDDQAEMSKKLLAIALEGDRLLLFDNVESGAAIGGAALDKAITARTIKDRILGKSQMTPELPFDTVVFASGNNLGVREDALRRVVNCRLESPLERPEEREDFRLRADCPCDCRGDLLAHARAARGPLVCDALTVLRGYIEAGRPAQGLRPMDFVAWCDLVRNAVHWAIDVDPCAGRKDLAAADDLTANMVPLLRGWRQLCGIKGRNALTVSEAIAILERGDPALADLRATVASFSREGKLSAMALGKRLAKIRRKNIGGLMLDYTKNGGYSEWSVGPAAVQ